MERSEEAPRVCKAVPSCRDWSLACRTLPNGWVLDLVPMVYNYRLVIESPADNAAGCYTDGWCFGRERIGEALFALAIWDGKGDPPGPWIKHTRTGRYGPGSKLGKDADLVEEP